mmetsp:Transcript_41020/g.78341  ORF Transcript_41020/g.78341 Transcript_41020/m.78341 type:complete len:201 (-) Transcript_41020:163-765(-)
MSGGLCLGRLAAWVIQRASTSVTASRTEGVWSNTRGLTAGTTTSTTVASGAPESTSASSARSTASRTAEWRWLRLGTIALIMFATYASRPPAPTVVVSFPVAAHAVLIISWKASAYECTSTATASSSTGTKAAASTRCSRGPPSSFIICKRSSSESSSTGTVPMRAFIAGSKGASIGLGSGSFSAAEVRIFIDNSRHFST